MQTNGIFGVRTIFHQQRMLTCGGHPSSTPSSHVPVTNPPPHIYYSASRGSATTSVLGFIAFTTVAATAAYYAVNNFMTETTAENWKQWMSWGAVGGVVAIATLAYAVVKLIGAKDALSGDVSSLNGTLAAKGREITTLTSRVGVLADLSGTYLEALLAVDTGKRQAALKSLATRLFASETPENLAKIFASMPEEIVSILQGKSDKPVAVETVSKIRAIIEKMDEKAQCALAIKIYASCSKPEEILLQLWGAVSRSRHGSNSYYSASAMEKIASIIAAELIVPGLIPALHGAAAESQFTVIRLAAVNLATPHDRNILGKLINDRDLEIRKIAAQKFFQLEAIQEADLLAVLKGHNSELCLAAINHDRATVAVIEEALNHGQEVVRSAAMGKIRVTPSLIYLLGVAAKSRFEDVRMGAVAISLLSGQGREILAGLVADGSSKVAEAAFKKLSPALNAAELEALSKTIKMHSVLWQIAEHTVALATTIGRCLSAMEKTFKVVDVAEEGHDEPSYDQYCSGSHVIDIEEQSHYEYEPSDCERALKILTSRPESFATACLSHITTDFKNVLGKTILAARREKALREFTAAPKGQVNQDLLKTIIDLLRLSGQPEQVALVAAMDPYKVGLIVKSLTQEEARALLDRLSPAFVALIALNMR